MTTQTRIPETAICRQCRYALQSLPTNVCPECGAEFDPRYPESYDDPADRERNWVAEKRAFWRLVVGRPGVLLFATTFLCVAWAGNSDGSIHDWFEVWSTPEQITAIVLLAALELVRFSIARSVRYRLAPWLVPSMDGTKSRYAACAAIAIMCLIWAARPWNDVMTFYFSRGALEKAILEAEQTDGPARFERIGQLDVRYIILLRPPRNGAFVQVGSSLEFGRYGFMYEPGVVDFATQVAPNWRIMNSRGPWR